MLIFKEYTLKENIDKNNIKMNHFYIVNFCLPMHIAIHAPFALNNKQNLNTFQTLAISHYFNYIACSIDDKLANSLIECRAFSIAILSCQNHVIMMTLILHN